MIRRKKLYLPIEQTVVTLDSSQNKSEAYKHLEFVKPEKVKKILKVYGFKT